MMDVTKYKLNDMCLHLKHGTDQVYIQTLDGTAMCKIMYGAGVTVATDLVSAYNSRMYKDAFDIMAANHLWVTSYGDDLRDRLRSVMNKPQRAAVNPTFQYDDEPEEADDTNYALDAGDTFGIGQPDRKSTKQWEPDVPDPSVDLMKSIHDACHR